MELTGAHEGLARMSAGLIFACTLPSTNRSQNCLHSGLTVTQGTQGTGGTACYSGVWFGRRARVGRDAPRHAALLELLLVHAPLALRAG